MDFYTKFKALCHLSAARDHVFEDKSEYKQFQVMDNFLSIRKIEQKQIEEGSVGIGRYAFTQGMMECRMYN